MKTPWVLGFCGVLVVVPSVADAAFSGRSGAKASFTASGPAGLEIVGTTSDLAVTEDPQGAVAVTVTLGTLTTGISLRDKHMREKYLEVQTYPTAVLRVPRAALKVPASGQSGTFDVPGTMTLHGTTKPVTFHYTAKNDGQTTYAVTGSIKLDMTDYGIQKPSYMGLAVKPSVDVAVSFTADDK